jgi:hypothetical protein
VRTYSRVTDTCDGVLKTYGQAYEGLEAAQALSSSDLGFLPGLRSDGVFRTNVEFVDVTSVTATVQVSFFSNGGTLIGSPITRIVAPNHRVGVTAALPAGVTSAFAMVQVTPADAQVIGFASVIDGASTDPTTVTMVVASGAAAAAGVR